MLHTPEVKRRLILAGIASLLLVPAAGPALAAEKPVAKEKNPPGDIPDDQVFIDYVSTLGFAIKVPEGWARKERAYGVSFADKFGSVDVTIAAAPEAPTPATVKAEDAAALVQNGRAVQVGRIKAVKLLSGPAVVMSYTSNSEPNAVTARQIRLEHDRYFAFKDGKRATIDFSAPAGADNVDQWQLMSQSFSWK